MSMDMKTRIPIMSVILALGALANILLVFCLAHTWKFWRQVKWYVILLAVGNVLDVAFTQGTVLQAYVTGSMWSDISSDTCRFMVFLHILGPSLSAMAVAALSLHVLLTSLTGCQGTRLRHALVLGLFVLLGFALPLAKIPLFGVKVFNVGFNETHSVCVMKADNREAYLQLQVGESVAVTFFPLFVTLCCALTSAFLLLGTGRVSEKGDADKSDLILTGLLGAALLICCLPYHIYALVLNSQRGSNLPDFELLFNLQYLMDCSCFATAVIAIVFAYVHAYRNRGGEFLVIPGGSDKASGERQKLVN